MDTPAAAGPGTTTPAARPWAPLVVGAMTLALTLYLSFQSSELHTVERVLREHEAIAGEQPRQKLYQAWKKVRHERALGSAGAPMDEVQRLIEAGRDLVDKRGAVQDELLQAQALHLVPPQLWAGPQALMQALMPSAQAGPSAPGTLVPAAGGVDGAAALSCAVAGPPPPVAGTKARAPRSPQEELAAHQQEFTCFLQTLGIVAGEFDYPTWGAVFAARDKVTLLVSWLLPGLYGLLGACFFLMRTMLQTGRERLPGSGRALAAVDILLRMAAGGLAGIIVGWFAVPAAGGVPVGGVSSLSFGLAFLAGFSTDALFTMLDGVLRGLGNRERDDTAPRPGPA
jgi:hypothetical protein